MRLPLALTALLLGACTQITTLPKWLYLDQPRVVVPFTLQNGMAVVQARLGKRRDLLGIVDTGASGLMLTPRIEQAAHLTHHDRRIEVTGVDGKEMRDIPFATIDKLGLSGIELPKLEGLVVRELERADEAIGLPFDLLVGGTLFNTLLLTIDYPHQQLVIEQGALPAPDGQNVLTADFSKDVPRIALVVAGVPVVATIDTGCTSWIDLPAALADKLPLYRPATFAHKHTGVNGDGRDRVGRLAGPVQLGRYTMVDTPLDFTPGDARICAKLLANFVITIDAHNNRVRFYRDDNAPIAIAPERTDGIGILKRAGSWRIADLIPDQAPANVQLDDVILSVNGRNADPLTRNDWNSVLTSDALHLVLRRGAETFAVDVPVREIGTF